MRRHENTVSHTLCGGSPQRRYGVVVVGLVVLLIVESGFSCFASFTSCALSGAFGSSLSTCCTAL